MKFWLFLQIHKFFFVFEKISFHKDVVLVIDMRVVVCIDRFFQLMKNLKIFYKFKLWTNSFLITSLNFGLDIEVLVITNY